MLKLRKTNTVSMPVAMRIPTDTPDVFVEGAITCKVKILSKQEVAEMLEERLSDEAWARRVLVSVDGLGTEEGIPIDGEAAVKEVIEGPWSSYLTNGIVQAYFEQFADARAKNSKPSRGR